MHFQYASNPNFSLDRHIQLVQINLQTDLGSQTGSIDALTARENHRWLPSLLNRAQTYKEKQKNGGETESDAKMENQA